MNARRATRTDRAQWTRGAPAPAGPQTPQPAPTFCTIIPPHLLDAACQAEDPALHNPARRTLERDAAHRIRRLSAARGVPEAVRAGTVTEGEKKPKRSVYDANGREELPGEQVRTEGSAPVADASANRAYNGLGATFELFLNAYGHYSIDGAGMPLKASVHYGQQYGNAFWDGQQMVFGDGDDEVFRDMTLAVDVIGHELTHGVTQFTADLKYSGQSGALNESVSDVFGSLIKQYGLGQTADEADWLVGAGLFTERVRGKALRSLKAPGTAYDDDVLGKDPQPSRMADYVRTDNDNGGVHINSGIPNHAFYQLATELGGKAWERAGQIWFDALTRQELAPNANFTAFATATAAAASERYGPGSAEHGAVMKSWSQVGVEPS